ncbi:hypothetical protein GO986_08740 [Deinococcus sp. HMF7620]|uniref:Uncharacterized protein n=1 Tax=Deinococcus arboris TaxID=2682977 RepID=A0A7C9HRC6_9DEIO|nr:hypothetical protein [Deinococcus arboris]MVN86849.1 hypothetical protein [Deinococcus arboris]
MSSTRFHLGTTIEHDCEITVTVEFKHTVKLDQPLSSAQQAEFMGRIVQAGLKEGLLSGIDWAITGEDQ